MGTVLNFHLDYMRIEFVSMCLNVVAKQLCFYCLLPMTRNSWVQQLDETWSAAPELFESTRVFQWTFGGGH